MNATITTTKNTWTFTKTGSTLHSFDDEGRAICRKNIKRSNHGPLRDEATVDRLTSETDLFTKCANCAKKVAVVADVVEEVPAVGTTYTKTKGAKSLVCTVISTTTPVIDVRTGAAVPSYVEFKLTTPAGRLVNHGSLCAEMFNMMWAA